MDLDCDMRLFSYLLAGEEEDKLLQLEKNIKSYTSPCFTQGTKALAKFNRILYSSCPQPEGSTYKNYDKMYNSFCLSMKSGGLKDSHLSYSLLFFYTAVEFVQRGQKRMPTVSENERAFLVGQLLELAGRPSQIEITDNHTPLKWASDVEKKVPGFIFSILLNIAHLEDLFTDPGLFITLSELMNEFFTAEKGLGTVRAKLFVCMTEKAPITEWKSVRGWVYSDPHKLPQKAETFCKNEVDALPIENEVDALPIDLVDIDLGIGETKKKKKI